MPSRVKPASSGKAITPSDTEEFQASRGVMVGVAGDINVLFAIDTVPVVIPALTPGQVYPFSVIKILATNTSVTGIVILR
ncbi:MAG: hypothetical protein COA96_10355 [SAR86 cluster bacterium]|uniref:Uncharacterized protein n=1 Tax=SAR86 cluster bacterium TaxID=2030880 RepID=A0A2A5AZB0_9GAMM|nr:MAG: hypothetical protein COA96_10355 [SAR86 cluster bacterium]